MFHKTMTVEKTTEDINTLIQSLALWSFVTWALGHTSWVETHSVPQGSGSKAGWAFSATSVRSSYFASAYTIIQVNQLEIVNKNYLNNSDVS